MNRNWYDFDMAFILLVKWKHVFFICSFATNEIKIFSTSLDTPASITLHVSHVTRAGLEPTPVTAVRWSKMIEIQRPYPLGHGAAFV